MTSADINRDGVVDERDVSLFVNGWVQGEIDRRLDVNNNGRLETGPPNDPATGLPISNWDDDDLSLFTKEFVGLYQWRLANDPTTPDPTTALFDGTGTDADGIARGKLSREDIDNRIGAAGMWWDPHLGIYHVRHRAYDPRLGRFLQPDPIGVAGGWNVFEYVGGDPANYVDPMGLQRVPPGWPADPNGALFGIERGFRQEREAAFAWGRDLAGHVKIATETGVTVAAVGAIVILPGPEDVVLAAAMSRHGIAALKIVGDKLIGIMKGGDEIELVGKTADEVGDAVRKDGAVGHPARADAKSADEAAACKGPPDRAVDAASIKKKSPHELGNEGEHAVAQILGLPKNTKRIDSLSGTANYRIPDFLDEKNLRIIADSKNVKKLEPSDQLLDFALYAQKHGLAYRIYVRENTVISPAMREFATNNGIRVFRSLPPG
jgi:RHS repeat-associated protein